MAEHVHDFQAERLARIAAIEAEAQAAYELGHGRVPDDGAIPDSDPSVTELVGLLGGPENAGKVIGNLPAVGGIKVTSMSEMDDRNAAMQRFWASGGGRLPAEYQPQKPPPPPPPRALDSKFIRDCLADGDTLVGYWQ